MKTGIGKRILSLLMSAVTFTSMVLPAGADFLAFVETERVPGSVELTDAGGTVRISGGPEAEIPEDASLEVRTIEDDGAYRAAAE